MRRLLCIFVLLSAPLSAQVDYPPSTVVVESNTVTLDAGGNGTWTFTTPFAGTPDVTHLPKAMDTTNPLICNFTSVDSTQVSVHCWRTALLGLLTGLLSGPVTGGQVKLIARYKP